MSNNNEHDDSIYNFFVSYLKTDNPIGYLADEIYHVVVRYNDSGKFVVRAAGLDCDLMIKVSDSLNFDNRKELTSRVIYKVNGELYFVNRRDKPIENLVEEWNP